jgi:3-oxoacyl-[acyl-carrier-protein] synthase II
VVITGLGVVTSLGETVEDFWAALLAARSGVDTVKRFDVSRFDVRFGSECVDFDPFRYVDRKAAKRLDRFAQFAIAGAQQAAAQARFESNGLDVDRVGVIVGSGIGGLAELEQQHVRLLEKGPDKVSAFTIPKLMLNAASGNISILYGARGPNTSVATACASATNAMGDALATIQRGEADMMFTGGSEAALTPLGLAAFASMKALSMRNDDPPRGSRPFDRDRDGFVLGEGAGILIFEELEHARRRGVPILAEVLGFGMSGDASDIVQPQQEGAGAALAMQRALRDSGVKPEQVDYINAHGTSTPLGDEAETKAIKAVFGDYAYCLPISSTKSNVGHLLGASGAVEVVGTVMTLQHGVIPPTINLENPDDLCDLDYVPGEPRSKDVTVAMSNSFGFGGHNACIVVSRYADRSS